MGIVFKRVIGFLIDLMFAAVISILLSFISPEDYKEYPLYVGFILILCRDTLTKKGSIGKKILRLKLVSREEKETSILQKVLRNITSFLWPVEGLVLLISKRRIGDMIFKTDVKG